MIQNTSAINKLCEVSWNFNQWLHLQPMGSNMARRSENNHKNTTNPTNPKGRRHIPYGDNH